jgi:hypothetical protein
MATIMILQQLVENTKNVTMHHQTVKVIIMRMKTNMIIVHKMIKKQRSSTPNQATKAVTSQRKVPVRKSMGRMEF